MRRDDSALLQMLRQGAHEVLCLLPSAGLDQIQQGIDKMLGLHRTVGQTDQRPIDAGMEQKFFQGHGAEQGAPLVHYAEPGQQFAPLAALGRQQGGKHAIARAIGRGTALPHGQFPQSRLCQRKVGRDR